MTTPERLRRRQRIEGVFLVCIGIMVATSTVYFQQQDEEQRDCVAHNFSGLAETLSVRGDLSTREATAQKRDSRATRQLVRDAFASKSEVDFYAAYTAYRERLKRVAELRAEIAEVRAENPFPDFPEGTCDAE